MNLQDLFNLAARKGQASTIFVPQKQQPSYFETATKAPQKASTVFIPTPQPKSYLEIAGQTPQQASPIFVPTAPAQMPAYLETAAQSTSVSPLFKFPTKEREPKTTRRPAPAQQPVVAAVVPAGTVQPGAAIVSGLTPTGEVDRSQSDEYKSQMAQYRNLIAKKEEQKAEDLGMKIWMEKYGKTPMAQAGGAVGAYNPLLAKMFPETEGFGGSSAPVEEIQMGDLGTRAQGEGGWTMESINPLATQAAQQEATAAQADMATTVKLPVRNRVQAFLYGGM